MPLARKFWLLCAILYIYTTGTAVAMPSTNALLRLMGAGRHHILHGASLSAGKEGQVYANRRYQGRNDTKMTQALVWREGFREGDGRQAGLRHIRRKIIRFVLEPRSLQRVHCNVVWVGT
ncbi:hypothetical protein B0H13DRAFT_1867350 [Mycena leptocephala]|nr:hypothetical protein B0H13DRAFT_1867350 [Mycena leptocephala]